MRRIIWLLEALVLVACFNQEIGATPSRAYRAKAKGKIKARPITMENINSLPSTKSLAEEHGTRKEEHGTRSDSKRQEVDERRPVVNIKSCNANFCDPGWEPYPNIVSAMTGYNILKGNAYNFGTEQDPGFDNGYIFVPVVKDDDDRYALHGGITIRAISKCDLTLNSKTVSTVKGYQNLNRGVEGMFEGFKTNPPMEISVEGKGVGASMELPPLFEAYGTANNAQQENEEFFTKMHGVLTISDATCAMYSMQISRRYPPPFQQSFKNAVKALTDAGDDAEKRKTEFYRFIEDFGTHFLLKATIGARLSVLRRYDRDTFQEASSEQIEQCSKGRLAYWYVKEEGQNNCTSLENAGNLRIFNEMQREYIVSYGSKPETSLTDWANQDFEYPVPIKMTLVPILDLFHRDFMAHDEDLKWSGYNTLRGWMEPLYNNYCEEKKSELGITICNPSSIKRCGYNDNCNAAFEDCIQTEENDFECRTKINKNSIGEKLNEAMDEITHGMTANEVKRMIENSDVGRLHGVEIYAIVMNEGYGHLEAAGDNAVKVTKNSFSAAVAWANLNEVGDGRRTFESDVTSEINGKVCGAFDSRKVTSMDRIISAINQKGHSVKFMIQASQPEENRNHAKIARTATEPDYRIQTSCRRRLQIIMIGPGGSRH